MTRHAFAATAAATLLAAGTAGAAGLDRSNQSISALFADPGTLSFGISYVDPSLEGRDVRTGARGTYDAGESYSSYSYSYANRVNEAFSYAIIGDQPFGADIFYDANPAISNLGGTKADIQTDAITFLGRYEFGNGFSVFGGPRFQQVDATIALNGLAYAQAIGVNAVASQIPGVSSAMLGAALQGDPAAVAAFARATGTPQAALPTVLRRAGAQVQAAQGAFTAGGGYRLEVDEEWGTGYTVGVAYEIPEIALRLSVAYNSAIDYTLDSTELLGPAAGALRVPLDSLLPGRFDTETPQSVNVDFQTGINEKTLLLASYRWSEWGSFDVIPPVLGSDLANLDDGHRWTVGVARRFTEGLVGLASLSYEEDRGSATVSPLGPTDGQVGISLGARYSKDNLNVSGGISYVEVGSAFAGVGGRPVALFDDSSAVGIGLRVDYQF